MKCSPLKRSFYERPAIEVARALLGKIVLHGDRAGRIVETEAYLGLDDRAAHSSRGITPRTKVIFGPAGHAYVYLIYGMYECLNIVAETDGVPGCVLVRALEMIPNVHMSEARGPGKLTRAMGITRALNAADVTSGPLTIHAALRESKFEIGVSPRIGITQSADLPLRFYIEGNACVSRPPTRLR